MLKSEEIQRIEKNLKKEIRKIKKVTYQGIFQACELVRGRAMEKTPVDTGNLKNSAYTKMDAGHGTSAKPTGEVGFTAKYSIYVHENLEARHPTGEAKFLEKALQESEKDIVKIIEREAGVK